MDQGAIHLMGAQFGSCMLATMPRPSPFARGFRAVRREPSVLLAEIGWRWVFGGIATALLAWATILFLRSVTVSKSNELLLRSLNPELMSYALRELFQGKGWTFARLAAIVSLCLSVQWVITATIARTATTRVLLDDSAENYGAERETRPQIRTVAAIQLVRVALLWVGLAAYFLSAFVSARLTTTGDKTDTGSFLLIFSAMFLVAAVVLSFFNWLLLLAPIFALRDQLSFADSTISAWRITRDRAGSFVGLNLGHMALRIAWFVFISGLAFVPLGFARIFPKWLIFAAVVLITMAYSAGADILFVARYAGYIEIAEQEIQPERKSLEVNVLPIPKPAVAPETSVIRENPGN